MSIFLDTINSEFEKRKASNLEEFRVNAFQKFSEEGFPTIKDEEWRFTNLKPVVEKQYVLPETTDNLSLEDIKDYFVPNLDSHKLVFLNGVFNENLSNIEGVEFFPVAKARENAVFEKYFNKVLKNENTLESLNTALFTDGYYIHVKHNQLVDKPIEVLFVTTEDKASFVQPRNLIVVGDKTHLNVIESHISLSSESHFTNAITEVVAGEESKVNIYKTQNDHHSTALVDQVFARQLKGSNVSIDTLSFGGYFIRNGLNFKQIGEECNSLMQAVTVGEGSQLVDHHTLVEHTAPHCESHELYRTILNDASKGVFNGKIIVEDNAQKIDAFQQNNNILLSDDATINTKPQLEIFADDVKCSHGCTVGQLDKDALFYMQQRGIPTKEAKAFLLYAFSADVLSSIEVDALREYWTQLLAKKLGVDITF